MLRHAAGGAFLAMMKKSQGEKKSGREGWHTVDKSGNAPANQIRRRSSASADEQVEQAALPPRHDRESRLRQMNCEGPHGVPSDEKQYSDAAEHEKGDGGENASDGKENIAVRSNGFANNISNQRNQPIKDHN